GDDVIISPSLSNDDARQHFPEGWNTKTPYLRVVRQPEQ
ncbi:peroxidase, partial [Halomonas sp. MES3-P3E]